jgi:hypothetical protein
VLSCRPPGAPISSGAQRPYVEQFGQRGGEVLYARRAALSDLVNGNAALSAELTLRIASSREALLAMTPRNPVGTGLQILLESWAFASRPAQWIPLCLPADHPRSATGGTVCEAPKQRSMRLLVTDGPHVI